MTASFDIVIPCYCYGRYLRQCVQSVLEQVGVSVRAIIVDDASTDDTPEVAAALVREDRRVLYLRNEINLRQVATYNRGLDLISADYTLLLSADDYLVPGALARAADVLDRHKRVGLLFGQASALFDDGTALPMRPLRGDQIMAGQRYLERFAGTNPIATPTAIVRTSIQRAVGFYDPALPHSGDMEMWMRIAALSDVAYLDVEQAVYRHHSRNMSKAYFASVLPDIEQRQLATQRFFKTSGQRLKNPSALLRRINRRLALDTVRGASTAFNAGDPDLCDRLRTKALEVFPPVWASLAWHKLNVKRLMGIRLWQALSPVLRS